MRLLDVARKDVLRITTNTKEWAVPIMFKTPPSGPFDYTFDVSFNNSQMFTLYGLHTKHLMEVKMDTQERVNTKKSSVTVSEFAFNAVGYPVRDANGEVNLLEHQVAVKDSTGVVCNYVVIQNYPDETLGLIVCILGDLSS